MQLVKCSNLYVFLNICCPYHAPHIFTSHSPLYLLKKAFNITLQHTLRSSKWSFSFQWTYYNLSSVREVVFLIFPSLLSVRWLLESRIGLIHKSVYIRHFSSVGDRIWCCGFARCLFFKSLNTTPCHSVGMTKYDPRRLVSSLTPLLESRRIYVTHFRL